jgi:hypothetical protein
MRTGTDDPARSVESRRRGRLQVALSAVGVLVIAGGALLAVRTLGGGSDRTAATGSPRAELTINGRTVHRDGATAITSVHAANGTATTLLVFAGSENPAVPNPCYPWTDVRVVGQDDRTVTLAATRYVDRTGGSDVVCTDIGRPVGRFSVPLAGPLGTRSVVQDGRVLPVLLTDTRMHATVLPDGYAGPPRVSDDPKSPGLTRTTYSGPDRDTFLEIDEGRLGQPPTDPERSAMVRVLDRLTVRGHPAVFRQDGGFDDVRCLVWAETASIGVAVCSHGVPAPLTAAQLAAVADGLVRS